MPRAKQPYCIDCGILKTVDNCSTKKSHNDKLYFQARCTPCNTARLITLRHSGESLNKLYELREKHMRNYLRICKTIDMRLKK
jgi:hypothetical protein